MRRLLLFIGALALCFCAYYFALYSGLKRALADAPTTLAEDGLTLSLPAVQYSGFPLMLRADMSDPQLTGPDGNLRAEAMRLSASVFSPTVWTAQTRGDLRVDWRQSPQKRYLFDISPSLMQARFTASLTGRLKAVRVTGLKLTATPVIGQAPPLRALDKALLEIAPNDAGDMAFSLKVDNAYLDRESARDWQRAFGPHIAQILLGGTAAGLDALDDDAVAKWKAAGTIALDQSEIIWGDMTIAPELAMQLSGPQNTGTLTLALVKPEALIDALIRAEVLTGNAASFAPFALMAAPRDDSGRVVLSLPIKDGQITLLGQRIYPPL